MTCDHEDRTRIENKLEDLLLDQPLCSNCLPNSHNEELQLGGFKQLKAESAQLPCI